jgi:sulfopyruvate decarboxylase TPP-binding subunit
MLDGAAVAAALKSCGITHVLWVPDSELGRWEPALAGEPAVQLVRVCREGEAIAIAGGLSLGGKRPLVMMQCTGLFDSGDALRNFVHDLGLPLQFLVGVRSWRAAQKGPTFDTCPRFTLPILDAWGLRCDWLDQGATAETLAELIRRAQAEGRAGVVLLPE